MIFRIEEAGLILYFEEFVAVRDEAKIVLPSLIFRQPRLEDNYLLAAQDFLYGAEVLCDAGGNSMASCTLLAGQALENTLKAFLSIKGISEVGLKGVQLRHNLLALWGECSKHGLDIITPHPDWCRLLSEIYGRPYIIRYRKNYDGAFVHGLQYPNQIEMTEGIRRVFEVVREVASSARMHNCDL